MYVCVRSCICGLVRCALCEGTVHLCTRVPVCVVVVRGTADVSTGVHLCIEYNMCTMMRVLAFPLWYLCQNVLLRMCNPLASELYVDMFCMCVITCVLYLYYRKQ